MIRNLRKDQTVKFHSTRPPSCPSGPKCTIVPKNQWFRHPHLAVRRFHTARTEIASLFG